MGKDFQYYALWRLLEPEALSTKEAFDGFPPDSRRHHFIRRTKEEMVDFSGSPIYKPLSISTLSPGSSSNAHSNIRRSSLGRNVRYLISFSAIPNSWKLSSRHKASKGANAANPA